MNCKYLKIKLNHKLECKKLNKPIICSNCANCMYKEYKMHNKSTNTVQISPKKQFSKMENKSPKLRKLERDRFSLFTDDLEHCYLCPKDKEHCKPKDHLHEVVFGKNRQNSMKYGLVLPLCEKHHRLMHHDSVIQLKYKKRGQELFNSTYPGLNFIDIFHKNYL